MPKSVGGRVKARRNELGMSQLELAKRASITQPTISALERGESQSSGSLASIADALGVSALWLETGLGNKEIAPAGSFRRVYANGIESEPEYEIKLLEAKGSCGNGRYSFSNGDEFKTPIIKEDRWFQRFNVKPENVVALIADGFSMSNFIVHGDIVYVNTTIQYLKSGDIYLIDTPDGLRVKRVHRRADGSVILSSDNPDKTIYPDELYSASDAEHITIKGRFICREG